MQNLLEMGFEEDDVIDALRNHGNRQEEAVRMTLWHIASQPECRGGEGAQFYRQLAVGVPELSRNIEKN